MQTEKILAFAREEWERYSARVTGEAALPLELRVDESMDARLDEYAVSGDRRGASVAGATPRAVLFGVYALCEELLGVRFLRPGKEYAPHRAASELAAVSLSRKAAFPVRAYAVDRPTAYAEPIDALFKLGFNAFSISAAAWEKNKQDMQPEMEKRGMTLAVSGHDIGFFLPPERYFDAHPDWFSLYEGKRIPGQMCYASESFADELAAAIERYARQEGIGEITLMFNDNAMTCTCDRCRREGFMGTYLRLINRVQRRLRERGAAVEVYSIAYNAALAWDMLEVIPPEADSSCIIACWGRDYRYSLSEEGDENAKRFTDTFRRWGRHLKEKQKAYAVFEYYGDHWMMGTLLPPFGEMLSKDLPAMRELGVSRLDFLHFGFEGSLQTMREIVEECGLPVYIHHERSTEAYVLWYNLFMAGRMMWEPSETFDDCLRRYTRAAFGAAAPAAARFYKKTERAMAGLSRFAASMFKLRLTDAWYRDDFSDKGTHKTHVHPWTPGTCSRALTEEAAAACRTAAEQLTDALGELPAAAAEENVRDLRACGRYLADKLTSLHAQYSAQLALEEGDRAAARPYLEQALALAESYDGDEIEMCRAWLGRCDG